MKGANDMLKTKCDQAIAWAFFENRTLTRGYRLPARRAHSPRIQGYQQQPIRVRKARAGNP